MKNKKTICDAHSDCFANKRGECVALSDTHFVNRDCPFYKTQAEHLKSRIAAAEKLKSSGRDDMIELHYKSRKLFEKTLLSDKAELAALRGGDKK